jgi:hypothetical protein
MTKSTITRERIQRIIRAINSEAYDEEEIREWLSSDEIMELSRMALAAMDSEPVAIIDQANLDYLRSGADADVWPPEREEMGDVLLYRHAQPVEQENDMSRICAESYQVVGALAEALNIFDDPCVIKALDNLSAQELIHEDVLPFSVDESAQPAPERDQVRREHAEWSQSTFGNVGPVGPLKHLSKEALEAAEQPGDLSEWADIQFLLWDAQRRAGITDDQITQAMIDKLAVNKQREWPEPKDGEPRLHIKEQPAPVVPDENTLRIQGIEALEEFLTVTTPEPEMVGGIKLAMTCCRALKAIIKNNGWADFNGGKPEKVKAETIISALREPHSDACRAAMLNGGNDE